MTLAHVVGFLVGVGAATVLFAAASIVAWWTDGPDPDTDTPGTERWQLRTITRHDAHTRRRHLHHVRHDRTA